MNTVENKETPKNNCRAKQSAAGAEEQTVLQEKISRADTTGGPEKHTQREYAKR